MRKTAYYLTIVAFILLTSSLAAKQATVSKAQKNRVEEALAAARSVETAYAPNSENAVLGATDVKNATVSEVLRLNGVDGVNALNLLQQSHIVIVEYTSEGAVVKSIDGLGTTESDRDSGKKWIFSVNEKESILSPDRYITKKSEGIVWTYK